MGACEGKPRRKADTGDGDHADASGRGDDHHDGRSGAGAGEAWEEDEPRHPGAVARSQLRSQGRAVREHSARVQLQAEKDLAQVHELGKDELLVCMAKTQYSLSDDPALLGRPSGFTVTVREVRLSAGAGFLVAVTGSIMTMPGLPKKPAALSIDIDEKGRITGLF